MPRPRIARFVLLVGALLATACGGDDDAAPTGAGDDDGRLVVVTTVSPITSIASDVIGDLATIRGVVPEGTNSHTYEPTPSVSEVLEGADVVFANDSESALLPGEPSTLTIVKDGPRPVRVRGCPEAFEVDVPPLPGVTDSTGAGDAFAAGYLVSATRGESVRDSVTSAIERAAQHLHRQRYRGPSP